MKRIKPHINTYCTYCKKLGIMKVKAIWRVSYNLDNTACEEHKHLLPVPKPEHYSEADYQTWMRL